MGAGRSGKYSGTRGSYNSAKSKSVRKVDKVNVVKNKHKLDTKGERNSVTKSYKNGELERERYYDEKGDVYLDIDYNSHGNYKEHPIVPHEHKWLLDKTGKLTRTEGEIING